MLSTLIASQVATAIVNHQKDIIGPLALEQAKKVPGVIVSASQIEIQTDPSGSLTKLVEKYEELFGQTSIEVCKDAVRELAGTISQKDLPSILQ